LITSETFDIDVHSFMMLSATARRIAIRY